MCPRKGTECVSARKGRVVYVRARRTERVRKAVGFLGGFKGNQQLACAVALLPTGFLEGFKGHQQLVCAVALLPTGFLEGFKGHQQLVYAV